MEFLINIPHMVRFLKARKAFITTHAAYRTDPAKDGIKDKLPSAKQLWESDHLWVDSCHAYSGFPVMGTAVAGGTLIHGATQERVAYVKTHEFLKECERLVAAHPQATNVLTEVTERLDLVMSVGEWVTTVDGRAVDRSEVVEWLDHVNFLRQLNIAYVTHFDVVRSLMSAVSSDTTRKNLCGVHYNASRERFEASDGHRVHIAKAHNSTFPAERVSRTIDIEALEVARMVKGAHLQVLERDPTSRWLMIDHGTFVSLRTHDAFPDIQRIASPWYNMGSPTWGLASKDLTALVKAGAADILKGDVKCLRLRGTDTMLCAQAWRPACEEVAGTHSTGLTHHALPLGFELGMNPKYLLDAIKFVKASVIYIWVTDQYSPVFIADSADCFAAQRVALVMPVRI